MGLVERISGEKVFHTDLVTVQKDMRHVEKDEQQKKSETLVDLWKVLGLQTQGDNF